MSDEYFNVGQRKGIDPFAHLKGRVHPALLHNLCVRHNPFNTDLTISP